MIPLEDPFQNAMQILHPLFPGGMRIDQMVAELVKQRKDYEARAVKAELLASKLQRELEKHFPPLQ